MIDLPINRRPGDERGFIHKKILGGIAKVAGIIPVPGARVVSRVARTLAGSRRAEVPRIQTARVTATSLDERQQGLITKLEGQDFLNITNGTGPCPEPLVLAPDGHCVAVGSGHYRQHFGATPGDVGVPVGNAVMGRYGAALTPGSMIIDRAVCLKGMQLANDGLCYNKSQISNKQRMWPAGRKPLLSGGDMRAIGIAARAGRRLEGATKRLQRLGMMKKPAGRRGPTQHQRLLESHVTK